MMKRLLYICAMLWTVAQAQVPEQFLGNPNNRVVTKGQHKVDSIFFLPNRPDTTFNPGLPGAQIFRTADKHFYLYDGTAWKRLLITGDVAATVWGGITGTLSAQTDLQTALDAKVPLTRTLTINGTAFDLSSNRTWNVGTVTSVGVTGGWGIGTITGSPVTGAGSITIPLDSSSASGVVSKDRLANSLANAWSLGGNSVASARNLGTTTNFDLPFITNNAENARIIAATGNVMIGRTADSSGFRLFVNGGQSYFANTITIKHPTFTIASPLYGKIGWIANNQFQIIGGPGGENIVLGGGGANKISMNANATEFSGQVWTTQILGTGLSAGSTNLSGLLINISGGIIPNNAGANNQYGVSLTPNVAPTSTAAIRAINFRIAPTINMGAGASGFTFYGGVNYEPVLTNTTGLLNHVAFSNSAGDNWLNKLGTGSTLIGDSITTASAILEARSTTKGFLVPRMTSAQRTSISSPATGLKVYQTDGTAGFYYYTGSVWVRQGSEDRSFLQGGNAFAATATLGTTDANALNIVTNGTTKLNIGTTIPDGAATDSLLVINSTVLKKVARIATAFVNTVGTTDATPTTITTIAVPTSAVIIVDVDITFASGSDRSSFSRKIRVKNISGTLTILNTSTIGTDYTGDAPLSTSTVSATTSGTNLLLQVAGVAATSGTWTANGNYKTE